MSVIIKGIDKRPVSCFECPLKNGSDECVLLDSDTNFVYDDLDLAQTEMCPIIGELPKKHGRLIDVDEYCELQGCDGEDNDCKNCVIRDCKTILESEE